MHKTCHVRIVDHTQASIQDWRLLVKLEKNPSVYLRQASIQIWLLFKEIWYMCATVIANTASIAGIRELKA